MHNLRTYFCATTLMLSLSGCVTMDQAMQKRLESVPAHEIGYVLGTYKAGCWATKKGGCQQPFNAITAYYNSVSSPDLQGALSLQHGGMFGGNTVYDFENADLLEKGIYFCQPLPAGEYQMISYSYWNFAGGGNGYRLDKKNQFDIRFNVAAGELRHIGNIKATLESGKNVFGMTVYGPGQIELSGASEDEQRLALEKCPESVRLAPLATELLRQPGGEHPLVRFIRKN